MTSQAKLGCCSCFYHDRFLINMLTNFSPAQKKHSHFNIYLSHCIRNLGSDIHSLFGPIFGDIRRKCVCKCCLAWLWLSARSVGRHISCFKRVNPWERTRSRRSCWPPPSPTFFLSSLLLSFFLSFFFPTFGFRAYIYNIGITQQVSMWTDVTRRGLTLLRNHPFANIRSWLVYIFITHTHTNTNTYM